MGDYSNAMRDAELIVKEQPDTKEYWNLKGNVHSLFGDYQQAIESYSEAIRIDYEYGAAFYNRGLAHAMSQNPIPACSDLQRSAGLEFVKAELALNNLCVR